MYLSFLKSPKLPWSLKPSSAVLNKSATVFPIMQHRRICRPSFALQNEASVSMTNTHPPMGAPSVAATPAPAPAAVKVRLQNKFSAIQADISLDQKHFGSMITNIFL